MSGYNNKMQRDSARCVSLAAVLLLRQRERESALYDTAHAKRRQGTAGADLRGRQGYITARE